ncbi:MAG: hypothetical protein COV36_00790 [Alphaproteobacteria bacterium CG11_big_fil_rev_8_21_14_0_20_44_7]|nr:MAG: hypothetical protein COV36_00790 [Alphaproteobacteria bacterium CG11_big_fil_rev_8_21_14_0_20_44_7]
MPHLDISTYVGQLFWLTIFFVMLYTLTSRLILPRVSEVLDARNDHIADDIDKAENYRNEAEEVDKKQHLTLHKANEEARLIIDEAQQKVEVKMDAKRKEFMKRLEENTSKAEKEIARIEADSERVIKKISEDISNLIEAKIAA